MAAQIGDLAVRVGANTVDLEKGMAKASRAVKNFSRTSVKQLRSAATAATKMGTAAVAAGAAITTALYVKQSKVIDSLAKTADALNLTTEGLQALNHLAELNGVSAESMAKGLRRMEVNLGMAARQGGAAANALKDVGVNINDIIKLSPEDQIQALSDAIANVENQSIKASIATDLFGRDGVAMLKVLNQIEKDGLEPTIKKLDEYGIAISRIDAAQVEAANDAFLEAQRVVEGLGNTLTVELAPFVKELSERFTRLAVESGGFGDIVESSVRKSIHFVGQLADVVHGLRVVFKGVELVAVGFGAAVVSVVQVAAEAMTVFTDSALKQVNKVVGALNKIPNVEIAKVDLFTDSEFMNGLRSMGEEIREHVGTVRTELNTLALTEMPSTAVEEFLEKVKEKSIETAQVVADARDAMVNPETEETDEERYAKKEAQYQEHMIMMQSISREGNKGIESLTKKHWGLATSETAGAMKSVIGTMSTGSKRAFEISKAWAIADTLISTAQGIAAGVKLGWPMAIPAVAWAAATGFAQLSAIKSQSYSGSGGGGGGSAPAAPQAAAPQAPAQGGGAGSGQTLTVDAIDPSAIFSGASMQAFGEKIHDFSKDGGQVVFAQ